jgi:hypothetical protein
LKPNITITPNAEDPTLQVITFDPPVASWSFADGRTSDELWQELTQASSHLLIGHLASDFTEEIQAKLKSRILQVLLYWVSQKWLQIPDAPASI